MLRILTENANIILAILGIILVVLLVALWVAFKKSGNSRRTRQSNSRTKAGARGGVDKSRETLYLDDAYDDEEDEEDDVYEEEGRSLQEPKRQWKIVLEEQQAGEEVSFVFYDQVMIGRDGRNANCERFFSISDDPRISKIHCALLNWEDKLYIKDMESSNGTYLNGKRIHRPFLLQKNDIIGLGETTLLVKRILRERNQGE